MTTNQSNNLRPCPFCGEQVFTPLVSSLDDGYTRCISCGAKMQRSRWQSRPIEDELRKRIAELEALVDKLIEAGEVMKQACGDQWGWEDMFDDSEFTDFDDLATGWKERER